MDTRIVLFGITAALLGAGALAVVRPSASAAPREEVAPPSASPRATAVVEGFNEPMGDMLPPNHPPIGSAAAGALPPASNEAPAITWAVPAHWNIASSPSTMRLATYQVAAATPGKEAAEMSVVRAGGTADANIERWLGQFDDAGQDTRTNKLVHGFKVTIVEVAGTYTGGGMMAGAPAVPKRGWALLGAIVETPGSPYFFKLTGDAQTVHAARAGFQALIDSIKPS